MTISHAQASSTARNKQNSKQLLFYDFSNIQSGEVV